MKIKNFSTGVAANKSIAEIEKILTDFGAEAIMKSYTGDGKVKSLAFKYQNNAYMLPSNVDGVYQVMFANKKTYRKVNANKNREEQAYRIAWRLLKDWIHAQISIVYSGQATPDQIMLPYMYNGQKTVYEMYKAGKLQLQEAKDGQV
jgi:hypothetical protein